MKIDKKAVGRRIKQLRISKGYTLEAFGKLFGAKKVMFTAGRKVIIYPIKNDCIIFQNLQK